MRSIVSLVTPNYHMIKKIKRVSGFLGSKGTPIPISNSEAQRISQQVIDGVEKTKSNTGLNLILALSYGSRQELIRAIKRTFKRVKELNLEIDNIDETLLSSELYTADIPDPDLIIRTGGEYRLSNFLLWQSAYSELLISETFWPDFRESDLLNSMLTIKIDKGGLGKLLSR